MSKKVLIACDSFKNSFTSLELSKFFQNSLTIKEKQTLVVADGGEGTMEALFHQNSSLERIFCTVKDPLFRDHEVFFLFDKKIKIAYISLADTCGFQHVTANEMNPWNASSFGFGECIQIALNKNAKTIYLFLGSSCTNDAGIGMAEALGYQFLSKEKKVIQSITPAVFKEIDSIKKPAKHELASQCTFICVTDVTNPLLGEKGATFVYSAQKGADPKSIPLLEKQMQHIANKVASISSMNPKTPGAGSAGGLGYGCMAFLGATNQSGADFIIDLLNVEEKVKNSDIVITGEGIIDQQTFHGKWVQSLAKLASKYKKPCVAICAYCQLNEQEVAMIPLNRVFALYKQLPTSIDFDESKTKLKELILEINDYIVHLN